MIMRFAVIIAFCVITMCCKKSKCQWASCQPCPESMAPVDGRDRMLVVGDSLSIGYTPHLQDSYPDMQVIHNECNGRNSKFGVENINRWVTHAPDWKVCLINHGIWDIMYSWTIYVPIDQYVENLRYEIGVLQTRCEKILFPTITKVPINFDPAIIRQGDEQLYNAAASTLMGEMGIPTCDIYSVSETISHLHDFPELQNDVHFIPEGARILADELVNCIDSL